ncbi:MAG: 5-formyltetrahydrofolate cyclo-ligase [Prevotella sp.]|nr:5-formyltetrahydrofolate cyclo-ligase [Prevotella sp.]
MTKQELRNSIIGERRKHSAEELAVKSAAVSERILRHPRIQEAKTVVAFWSLPDEPDISSVIVALYTQGKDVLLPCVTSDTEMVLRRYNGEESMSPGAFGILEPHGEESDIATLQRQPSVVLVPGVAFDRNGNRLGRGKGYYDRFLKKAGQVYTIGVCHDFQIVEEVPHGEYDMPVDELV